MIAVRGQHAASRSVPAGRGMVATCATNMTIEQFRAEYHLLDRVSDGTVETYHAQAAAGVMVMVHFLRGTESQNAAILERIERLETERRQRVLRTVEVDRVTAVVTRFILDLTTFEDWLGLEAASAPGEIREPEPDRPVTSPEQKPSTGTREPAPGEFTRLFAMRAQGQATPGQRVPEPTTAGPRPTAEPPPSVAPAPTAPAPPPAPLFRPTGPSMPGIGPPRTSKPGEPGAYTRMINPHLPDPPFRAGRAPAFSGPDADQRVGPAGAMERAQYDIDSYRARLAAPPTGASPFPPPPAAPPPQPPAVPTGPGEFTKVVESLPAPNLGPPPSAALPSPRPKPPPPSHKKLGLALLGVILAAIVFVVIFAVLA